MFNWKKALWHSLSLSMLVCGVLGTAYAAGSFEGVVHFTMKHDGQARVFDYALKGDKIRVDLGGDTGRMGSLIVDQHTNKRMVLVPEQRMVMDLPPLESLPIEKSAAASKFTLTRTGKTETILGYRCEQWVGQNDEGDTEIWAATGLGSFIGTGSGGGHGMGGSAEATPSWVKEMREQGAFPLRVVTKNREGQERDRVEATSIEKKALSEDLFAVPADYQRFDLEGMMRGMGGHPGAGRGGAQGYPGR